MNLKKCIHETIIAALDKTQVTIYKLAPLQNRSTKRYTEQIVIISISVQQCN